ncbi:MAG: DNA mismatch endonuclease Vsr [Candidatus Korobacteraceae bacterium]
MDNLSTQRRSANMRAVRSCDTQPERVVRRVSHGLGYRFRLHVDSLPGRPDLVFAGRRKVIFVHGCFWHHHSCKHGAQTPKTNTAFWTTKIAKNVKRDAETLLRLKAAGWRSLVVWECETKTQERLAARLRRFLA